jgi:hypothetical protein
MQLQTLAALALYLHVRSDAFHLQLAKFIPECIDDSVRGTTFDPIACCYCTFFPKPGWKLMEKYQQEADCSVWKMCRNIQDRMKNIEFY